MKRVVKIIIAIIGAVVLLGAVLIGVFVYQLNYAIETVDEVHSKDHGYTLILQSIGSPFLFGPADGRLLLEKGNRKIAVEKFTLYDDGGAIRPEIWQVTWGTTDVQVCITGSEQPDELITLGYDGTVTSLQEQPEK